MSDPTNATVPTIQPPAPTHEVPLHFVLHDFDVYCYNTSSCTVLYNYRDFTALFKDKPSGPPPSSDYKDHWGEASYIGIRNFPPSAEVSWKSLDGLAHEAKVDIAAIFKDGLIWHNVSKSDMADFYKGPVAGSPNIYLEVNDHTINVYMSMAIPTKAEQIPGNKYSYDRDDVFLVWTHTY